MKYHLCSKGNVNVMPAHRTLKKEAALWLGRRYEGGATRVLTCVLSGSHMEMSQWD